MIRLLSFAAAIALAVHVAPANAASVEVSYADLDLTSAQGHATLSARIDRAARKVCAAEDVRNLREMMAAKSCYRVALASAQPQLAALAARKTRAAA